MYQTLLSLFFVIVGFLGGLYAENVYINRPVIQIVDSKVLTKNDLQTKTGGDLEKAFLQSMVYDDDNVLGLIEAVYTNQNSQHRQLSTIVGQIAAARKAEQEQIKTLQKEWFGIETVQQIEQKTTPVKK